MQSPRLGVDAEKGNFYLLSVPCKAIGVVGAKLLRMFWSCLLSYHQVHGVPMGINPGVLIANYDLFWYEFRFVQNLVNLVHQHGINMA